MLKKWLVVFCLFALPVAAQDLVLQHQQTVVTLGNSITEMGEEPYGYVTVMRKALATLYPERRIYFVNSHPVKEVLAINRWLKALCEENGYDYIDFYTPVADEAGKMKKEWSSDGIHCNDQGYAAWTASVEEVLARWGITNK